ncbi:MULTISPECIES: NUDIX domain-containing protein [unclassified Mesorhizobium]|uniref:NUDIX hydrolase n=1 Tax=unclassified Mesorhizobium TaxID=325217 RepID=UPI0018DBFA4F
MRWIYKVGLAAERNGRLLVARKRGSGIFILPGGKPEGDESDLQTLSREIHEELGCGIEKLNLRGIFTDVAAGTSDAVVVVRLYSGQLVGDPHPCSEIEELAWVDIRRPTLRLAPSIKNGILPFLRKKGRSSSRAQRIDDAQQGALKIV